MASRKKEMEYLELLAKSWNNLDISFIEPVLSDNVIYESQWVLTPMVGKESFLTYMKSKFDTIREAVLYENMIVFAEMANHPEADNRPCIVLSQSQEVVTRKATVLLKVQKERIIRIDVCFAPNPLSAKLSGIRPI